MAGEGEGGYGMWPPQECSHLTLEKAEVSRSYVNNYYNKLCDDREKFNVEHSRPLQKKIQQKDFELLTLIGRGAFGEVRLCRRKKQPEKVMAIKKLHKQHMVNKNQVQHVRAERDVLVESGCNQKNPWITDLYYSFQDKDYLYLVMEFLPGGDMMTWLIKYDTFEESIAQFYAAELILAVHSIHKMRYAHRDIKPDNILLDRNGHIKLTDFGYANEGPHHHPHHHRLCKQFDVSNLPIDEILQCGVTETEEQPNTEQSYQDKKATWKGMRNRKMFWSAVGSPGYVAPEVLMKQGYSLDCDWWSVGIILYEMLCGYPPFYADDIMLTCHKIVKWREYLDFPPDGDCPSEAAIGMIKKLLCDPEERPSFDSIVSDRFFEGINWKNLRNQPPPFVPQLQSDLDVSYFDVPEADTNVAPQQRAIKDTKYLFYGFTAKLGGNTTKKHKSSKSRLPIPEEFRSPPEDTPK